MEDDGDIFEALRAAVGKTIAAVHFGTVRSAPSGKSVEYALADGEQVISSPDPSAALVVFSDGSELIVFADYDCDLNGKWVAPESNDSKRFKSSVEEG